MNKKDLRFQPEDPDPEKLEAQDLLGFMKIAEEEIIPDIESFKPPLIYGIYGRWESGKTFMMRALQKEFEKRDGYKTVWFDPWLYDHADKKQIFLGLLNKIQRTLRPKGSKIKKIGVDIAAGGLAAVRITVDAALSFLGGKIGASSASTKEAEKYFKTFQKLLGKEQLEAVDAVEDAHKKLHQEIEEALSRSGAKTLVLFVDDLDRCLPDRAILLLDQLKNFLYLPRVVTILGIDSEVFAEMLNKHYGYTGRYGKQYLSKIIQKYYRLTKGVVASFLDFYLPYCTFLGDCPNVIGLAEKLWNLVEDINLRKINRSIRKFVGIVNSPQFTALAVELVMDKIDTNSEDWQNYKNTIKKDVYPESTTSSSLMDSYMDQVAIAMCLWCVIALADKSIFPFDLKKIPEALMPFEKHYATPPIWSHNIVYEVFKTWL